MIDNDTREALKNQAIIELGKRSFWDYCKSLAPTFYNDSKVYLMLLAKILQGMYEGTLINPHTGLPYKKLMVNILPQHGKSRTITMFQTWLLGKSAENRIIYTSYNDKIAQNFSRYVRDTIMQLKVSNEYVFHDFFPNTNVKLKDRSVQRWALQGQHFNFLSAGIGGSVTSVGGTVLIVDDPIKGATEAMNELELDRIWEWYRGTLLSRVDSSVLEPLEIVVMTRWSKNDLCGRLLEADVDKEWLVVKMDAYSEQNYENNRKYMPPDVWANLSEEDRHMLSPTTFNYKRYSYVKKTMNPMIFQANYHQKTIDAKNALYSAFKLYDVSEINNYDCVYAMVDTADKGEDFFVSIVYGLKTFGNDVFAFILDVLYTDEPMVVTMNKLAEQLTKFDVKLCFIETNFSGEAFIIGVQNNLRNSGNQITVLQGFHESENKTAKILSYAHVVNNKIIMPTDWKYKWNAFYTHVTSYQRKGINAHDDPEDVLSNIAKKLNYNVDEYLTWARGL